MIFSHKNINNDGKRFILDGKVKAVANDVLNKNVLKDFWYGHAFHLSEIEFSKNSALEFVIGNPEKNVA